MAKVWKPLHDEVVVIPPEKQTMTDSGLHIPTQAQDSMKPQSGTVALVGPGRYLESGKFVETTVKPGEEVLFGAFAGVEHELNGRKCVLLKERDLLLHNTEEVDDAADIPVVSGAEVG